MKYVIRYTVSNVYQSVGEQQQEVILMPNFDNGVDSYIIGHCEIEVSFPVDYKGRADITCNQCPYYGRSSKTCQLNKQVVHYPEKYIGVYCPLTFEEKEYRNEQSDMCSR